MITLLAHAGEAHGTVTEATTHFLSDWYIALPLFILTVAGFAALVHLIFRKNYLTFTLVNIALLVIGFTSSSISSVVSVLSITLGLAGTLLMTLTTLGQPKSPTKATVAVKEDD